MNIEALLTKERYINVSTLIPVIDTGVAKVFICASASL